MDSLIFAEYVTVSCSCLEERSGLKFFPLSSINYERARRPLSPDIRTNSFSAREADVIWPVLVPVHSEENSPQALETCVPKLGTTSGHQHEFYVSTLRIDMSFDMQGILLSQPLVNIPRLI